MFPIELWAIGSFNRKVFMVLRQTFEYDSGGSRRPIWVREGGKSFKDPGVARRYLRFSGMENPTSDSVLGDIIHAELSVSLIDGEYFAKVSPVHEFLVHN